MMRLFALVVLSVFVLSVAAQQAGSVTAETHPSLTTSTCTSSGCTTQTSKVVLDANWRWSHDSGNQNCYTGNSWASKFPTTSSSSNSAAAQQCYLEGADYVNTYGISTAGNQLSLGYVTGSNVGSRTYLMKDDDNYQMFQLKNQEFTFDVDVSNLPCGLNGALYFVDMDQTGNKGMGANSAGARFGTGYCDAQCPQDIKFIGGQANVQGWNNGQGNMGACCQEMDIWEANKISTAYTPHPCNSQGLSTCSDPTTCGTGNNRYASTSICDRDGCDFNSYRLGNQSYYGPSMTIDTTQKLTVVTQFKTTDGTANGDLSEITRFYVQNGKMIPNSQSAVSGVTGSSITTDFCNKQKSVFGDTNDFAAKGGLQKMGQALGRGMVLVMSIWDDGATKMNWLDSTTGSGPGGARGSCGVNAGDPNTLRQNSPNSNVKFSNIRWGSIGSTTPGISGPTNGPVTTPAPTQSGQTTAAPTQAGQTTAAPTQAGQTTAAPTTTASPKPANQVTSAGVQLVASIFGTLAAFFYLMF